MEPRTAASRSSEDDAVAFVRFCYARRRVGWPELYDEMCAVAGRGLYRGYGPDDLAEIGIGLSLSALPGVAALARRIVAEEQARRRPVSVTITAEPVAIPVVSDDEGVTPAPGPDVVEATTPEPTLSPTIRLVAIPSGA